MKKECIKLDIYYKYTSVIYFKTKVMGGVL